MKESLLYLELSVANFGQKAAVQKEINKYKYQLPKRLTTVKIRTYSLLKLNLRFLH